MNDDNRPDAARVAEDLPVSATQPGWERRAIEQLAFAALKEQRTARRWKIFFRLAWLLFWCALVWAVFAAGSGAIGRAGSSDVLRQHTAVIEIDGEINASGENSAANLNAALQRAFENDQAKAVVLWVNSPGGSPVQAGIIHDEIRRLKALHQKPVYAVVEDLCASAAYYIAVAADDIYVDKASMIGSIGVLMNGFGFTDLMQKLGVERRLQTAGANKGMLDPFSPESPEQKRYLQGMLDQIHQQFIAVVRAGRGERLKEDANTFSGLVWTGQTAVDNGIADHLGDIGYVAREVVKADELVDYTERESLPDRLVRRLGASMATQAVDELIQKYSLN